MDSANLPSPVRSRSTGDVKVVVSHLLEYVMDCAQEGLQEEAKTIRDLCNVHTGVMDSCNEALALVRKDPQSGLPIGEAKIVELKRRLIIANENWDNAQLEAESARERKADEKARFKLVIKEHFANR